jgi:hypothetical protein
VANGFVAAALVGLIGMIIWWVLGKGWDAVIGADEAAFFAGRQAEDQSALSIGWMIAAVVVPTAVMVGLSAYLGSWWGVLGVYVILSVLFVPISLIALSAGGKTLDQAPRPAESAQPG